MIKMKRKILSVYLLTFFVSISSVFSQEKKNVEEDYLEYFKLPRESLFLHTNKTTYLTGEEVWFKAYAYDRKNGLSSKATTNVYLGIYNESGVQLDKKLYLAKEGAAAGHFAIDSTFASGDYFLKVSTNWMKNFKEDDSYLQKIKIINPKIEEKGKKEISKKEYDFQFLPEGGHILYDVKNTIGIKALNDLGKGTASSGVILNSKNEEVVSFKSNFLGIGKFTLTPKKGETYTAKVTLENSKEFEQSFSEIKNIGIAISVNNIRNDKTIITLQTNPESLSLFENKNFKLLLHKDGQVKTIPVVFNTTSKTIAIAQKDLFKGVNTITLFNEQNQPILERMFFNSTSIKDYSLMVERVESDSDSITYQLKSNINMGGELLDASISILPTQTVSYNPDHTIISALYLKPYLKGYIENPQYYFKNITRKKKYELDVLMVTQGWSRYSWDNIFNFPPTPSFDFENGISINGFVTTKVEKIASLFLYPTKQNKATFVDINKDGKFNIKNFYPEANEEVRFSYYNKKGKMKRPNMSLSYIKFMDIDNVNTTNYKSFVSFYKDKKISENFFIDDSYEELEEIKIKADLKEKLRKETRDPILVNGRVKKITIEEVESYPNITDFIQQNGFTVFIGDGATAPLGDVAIQSQGGRNGAASPTIFLDGVILADFNILLNYPTEQVDRIVIDKTGIGLGLSGGFGGAIKIYSRRGVFKRGGTATYNNTLFSNTSDYGFQPVKEFYTPIYASYRSQAFKDYGIIHWSPRVSISNTGSDTIKTVNTNLDEISFYVEGVSSDGTVFSQQIRIEDKNKP
jgi:hypothetical protein